MTLDEQKQNLIALHSFLNATGHFSFWEYDSNMNLLQSSCQDLAWDQLFQLLDGKKYALEHLQKQSTPLIFWHSCGLIWLIGYSYIQNDLQRVYVIGPLNSAENMMSHTTDVFSSLTLPISMKKHLKDQSGSLPTMSLFSVFPYTQMLHKALTGENLPKDQIHLQQDNSETVSTPFSGKQNYQLHQMRLQAVLQHIREGTLNYQEDWEQLSAISTGVSISLTNTIDRARISVITFITLCRQAAIDGGMSADMAFYRSSYYLERAQQCHTLGDLQSLNHSMYEDFVLGVRQNRSAQDISHPIQVCCDYIALNIEHKLSIQELADHIGYTEYYLARKFHREMHMSISEYINMTKINHAKHLLRDTDLDIQEISNRLHYCSHSYFSDVFRKTTDMTPTQYRLSMLSS